MSDIEIKHLFKTNRLTDNDWKFLSLLLYFNIGIILVLLRVILGICVLILSWILPNTPLAQRIIYKLTRFSLGISIVVENPSKKENVDVYISNSLSIFDQLVVCSVTGAVSPGSKSHPVLNKTLGLYDFGDHSNYDNLKKNIQTFIKEKQCPIYFSPEEKNTNGKAILKFKPYPFSIASKVQPISLTIARPFFDISVSCLGSSYWTDVFFYLLSPITTYKLKFLDLVEKGTSSEEEFSENVRQSLAADLKVEAVDFASSDLNEWEKREIAQRQRKEQNVFNNSNPTLRRMALQVKEVLPHVPLDAIHKDLFRTKSIDNTITNILEGRVRFTPENPAQNRSNSASTSSSNVIRPISSSSSQTFNASNVTFAKCAEDRTKSFQERKQILIQTARKKYIEKHKLSLAI